MHMLEYDERLAEEVLVPLACASGAVTKNIASRAIHEREDDRLYPGLVAKALLGDDCPPAAGLPDEVREKLEKLAAR